MPIGAPATDHAGLAIGTGGSLGRRLPQCCCFYRSTFLPLFALCYLASVVLKDRLIFFSSRFILVLSIRPMAGWAKSEASS
jgi:hypothetical protein